MHFAFCIIIYRRCGGTADALVSGSSVARRVGSNPVTCTNKMSTAISVVLVLFIRGMGFEGSKGMSHSPNARKS